jgi:hypothetical protein
VLIPVVFCVRGSSLVRVAVLSASCGDGVLLLEGVVEDMIPASGEDVVGFYVGEREKERKRQVVRW